MNLEFISANKDGRHRSEFLQHMEDLQNIPFGKVQSFTDIINLLKALNPEKEKLEAINKWAELNDRAKNMSAGEVFGLSEDGCATFNFRTE